MLCSITMHLFWSTITIIVTSRYFFLETCWSQPLSFSRGSSWTTDAPFRETAQLIATRREEGIIAVEMEAAALLAMGTALKKTIVCLAHITNSMAREDDFEKGGNTGTQQALDICAIALTAALEHAGGIIDESP